MSQLKIQGVIRHRPGEFVNEGAACLPMLGFLVMREPDQPVKTDG